VYHAQGMCTQLSNCTARTSHLVVRGAEFRLCNRRLGLAFRRPPATSASPCGASAAPASPPSSCRGCSRSCRGWHCGLVAQLRLRQGRVAHQGAEAGREGGHVVLHVSNVSDVSYVSYVSKSKGCQEVHAVLRLHLHGLGLHRLLLHR
jgi:hypothetical protein